jgi:biopolymer transport protein ExbB/TolQ
MKQRLYRRLQQLEVAQGRVDLVAEMQRRDAEQAGLLEIFVSFIEWREIVQTPQESIRQALARALEITTSELDEQLREGTNPIQKFFADRGEIADLQVE